MYSPALETVPTTALPPATPFTCQLTAVLLVPLTVAVNCRVPPVVSEADVGEMLSETVGAVTVTVAEADLVVSATLVAFTV